MSNCWAFEVQNKLARACGDELMHYVQCMKANGLDDHITKMTRSDPCKSEYVRMARCMVFEVFVPDYARHCAAEHKNILKMTDAIDLREPVSDEVFKKCKRNWEDCSFRKFRQSIEQLLQTAKINNSCKGATFQTKYMSADRLNEIDESDTAAASDAGVGKLYSRDEKAGPEMLWPKGRPQ